jgi:hypothetical protein
MSRFRRHAFATLVLAGGLLAGTAIEPPDNVMDEVKSAAQACKDLDGTPNADSVLRAADLNEDGGEDWIADYAKLDCAGGVNPMCGPDGCSLQIFLWNGAMAWPLAFDETVKRYSLTRRGGRPVLNVVLAGTACGKSSGDECDVTYDLDKDDIVPEP